MTRQQFQTLNSLQSNQTQLPFENESANSCHLYIVHSLMPQIEFFKPVWYRQDKPERRLKSSCSHDCRVARVDQFNSFCIRIVVTQ